MGNNPAPINQLNEPTPDGGPDEAAQENCVPASLAWVLEDLVGGTFDGDEIRDSVYPEGFTGGTNIPAYGSYAEDHGVILTAIYADNGAYLVAALHAAIGRGDDALVTIPSLWNDPPPADPAQYTGPTHVCAAAYVLDPDHLRLMNPWGGVWLDVSNEWLAPRLCYGVVWTASKIEEGHGMWTRNTDQTATDDHGHHVGQGLADAIFAHSLQTVDGLSGETPYDAQGHSYVALSNGVLLRWNGASVDQEAAFVVVALQEALDALRNAPTPEPGDPVAEAAKQALITLKAAFSQL